MNLKRWMIDGLALLFMVAVMVGAYGIWRDFKYTTEGVFGH